MSRNSRSVVLQEFGMPLEIRDFEVPEPAQGSAVVAVEYGGVCGTDVHLRNGKLPIPTPVVLGHEAVGRIHQLGPGLTHDVVGNTLNVGDAVSWLNNISCGKCFYCLVDQQPTLCTGSRKIYGINQRADVHPHISGGWGDHIYLQPGTVIVRLPDGVEPRDVIPLGCAGPTAVHGVLHETKIRVGDVVVIQGSGPVGVASAIYAQLAGASQVIIVGGPEGRLKQVRDLGIGTEWVDVFDGREVEERIAHVKSLTPGGNGADVVIECAGVPSAVAEGIEMARPNAQYCVVGQYTDHGTTPINPHLITRKQLAVRGSWGFSARHYIGYIESLPSILKRWNLSSLLTEYPLEDANRAVDDVSRGAVMKAVLRAGRG